MAVQLSDVRQYGDPLRSYNFDLVIPSMPGFGNGLFLRIGVTTTSIPGAGSNTFESNHHGHTLKHAGRGTHPRTLVAEYEETGNLDVINAFRSWRNLQWDPETGVQAPPDVYKTDGFLQLFNSSKELIKNMRIRGLFVEEIADAPLDGGADDSVKVSITFSYDDHVDI